MERARRQCVRGLRLRVEARSLRVLATTDEWDRVMGVNARGTFLCYKYAARQMITQGRGGRIVGAASVCAKKGMRVCSCTHALFCLPAL